MKQLLEDIRIRVSAEDRAAFEKQASEQGLSLSAWARGKLRFAAAGYLVADQVQSAGMVAGNIGLRVGMTVSGFMPDGTKIDWVVSAIELLQKKGRKR